MRLAFSALGERAWGETGRRIAVGRDGVGFPIVLVLVIVLPFNWALTTDTAN